MTPPVAALNAAPAFPSAPPPGALNPDRPMSYEEFLRDPEFDGVHAEWVEGYVIPMSPASYPHQLLSGFIRDLLQAYNRRRRAGVVLHAPFLMKSLPGLPGREPDLLFILNAHLHLVRHLQLQGPADLAVEILSPDSIARDRVEKFREYALGGVPEYWILDPAGTAEFFTLDTSAGPGYRPIPPGPGGALHSKVLPGFVLRPEWFTQFPFPDPDDCLREMNLESA